MNLRNNIDNLYFSRMSIQAQTWYRDSHGLFDYEEKEKLTLSNMKVKDNCKCRRRSTNIEKLKLTLLTLI